MNNFSILNFFLLAISIVLFSYKRNITENNKQVRREIKFNLDWRGKVNSERGSNDETFFETGPIFLSSNLNTIENLIYVLWKCLQMLSDIEIETVILEQRRENVAVCESHVKSLNLALSEMKESSALENSERKIAEIKLRNPKCLKSWNNIPSI